MCCFQGQSRALADLAACCPLGCLKLLHTYKGGEENFKCPVSTPPAPTSLCSVLLRGRSHFPKKTTAATLLAHRTRHHPSETLPAPPPARGKEIDSRVCVQVSAAQRGQAILSGAQFPLRLAGGSNPAFGPNIWL